MLICLSWILIRELLDFQVLVNDKLASAHADNQVIFYIGHLSGDLFMRDTWCTVGIASVLDVTGK